MKAFGRVFVAALALTLLLFACDEEQSAPDWFVEATNTPSREEYQQMIDAAKRTPSPTPEPSSEPDWDKIIAERAEQGYRPVYSPTDPNKVIGWKPIPSFGTSNPTPTPTPRPADAIQINNQWLSPSQERYVRLTNPTPDDIALLPKFENLKDLTLEITRAKTNKLVLPELPNLTHLAVSCTVEGVLFDARACKAIEHCIVYDWSPDEHPMVNLLLPDSITHLDAYDPVDLDYLATLPNLEVMDLHYHALHPDHPVTLPNVRSLTISYGEAVGDPTLDLSLFNAPNVTELTIAVTVGVSLGFESFPSFEKLTLHNTRRLAVDLSTAPKLETLYIYETYDLDIDVSAAKNLRSLSAVYVDPFDLSGISKLEHFKELYITDVVWDLTPLGGMSLDRLYYNPSSQDGTGDDVRASYKVFGKLASIKSLAISDAFIDDLTPVLDGVNGLERLDLFIDPLSLSVYWEKSTAHSGELVITVDNIELLDILETNIPLDQLRDLVKNGMGLQIMYDPNRQAF